MDISLSKDVDVFPDQFLQFCSTLQSLKDDAAAYSGNFGKDNIRPSWTAVNIDQLHSEACLQLLISTKTERMMSMQKFMMES
jgi:hypothetical protein